MDERGLAALAARRHMVLSLAELRELGLGVVHVSTARVGPKEVSGVALHRVSRLDALDVTEGDGIPVTSLARTIVDLAARLPEFRLVQVLHEAEVRRLLDVPAILAAFGRVPNRRGAGSLRRALVIRDAGPLRSAPPKAPSVSEMRIVVESLMVRP